MGLGLRMGQCRCQGRASDRWAWEGGRDVASVIWWPLRSRLPGVAGLVATTWGAAEGWVRAGGARRRTVLRQPVRRVSAVGMVVLRWGGDVAASVRPWRNWGRRGIVATAIAWLRWWGHPIPIGLRRCTIVRLGTIMRWGHLRGIALLTRRHHSYRHRAGSWASSHRAGTCTSPAPTRRVDGRLGL